MAPAVLIEVPSAANAAANGRDDVVARQDHLKDTRNELEALPGQPDKENAVGSLRDANRDGGSLPAVSAIEDDPFDSDDSDEDEDNEFMPRGSHKNPTETKSSSNQFVARKVRANGDNNVPTKAAQPAAPTGTASGERERVGEGESGRTAQLIASGGTSVPQGR